MGDSQFDLWGVRKEKDWSQTPHSAQQTQEPRSFSQNWGCSGDSLGLVEGGLGVTAPQSQRTVVGQS